MNILLPILVGVVTSLMGYNIYTTDKGFSFKNLCITSLWLIIVFII